MYRLSDKVQKRGTFRRGVSENGTKKMVKEDEVKDTKRAYLIYNFGIKFHIFF
jgi:hypothetical protein